MRHENFLSTYKLLGIPDGIAVAFVLVALSLSLVPWFGGNEIGPLKIPTIHGLQKRFLAFAAPLVLILLMSGFYPFWSTKPDAGEALRVSIQAPTQVGDLLAKAPSLDGERVYCRSARMTLIVAHEQNTRTPVVVHSLAVRSESKEASAIVGRCNVDPLSYRPYGIAEVGTYVAQFKESSVDVIFIENRDSALKSDWKNILYRDEKPHSIQLRENDEPHVLNLIVHTEKDAPIAVWIEAKFDEGDEYRVRTQEVVLWR